MGKRILCFLLAAGMLLVFAACGNAENNPLSSSPSATASPSENAEPKEAPTEVTTFTFTNGSITDLEKVLEKVNGITSEKINVIVKMQVVNSSAYKEQVNLMFASNEGFDLFWTGSAAFFDYTGQMGKSMLYPLTELIDKYGANIREKIPESYLRASSKNGELYAVTTIRDNAKGSSVGVESDLIEKYNLDVSQIKKVEDLEPVFETLHAKEPDRILLMEDTNSGQYALYMGEGTLTYSADWLTSKEGGALMDPYNENGDKTIANIYATDTYYQYCKTLYGYFQKGWTSNDLLTSGTTGYSYLSADRAFATVGSFNAWKANQYFNNTGKDMRILATNEPVTQSATIVNYMWALPFFTKVPEAAVKYLDLMFGDAELINLLCYGIEGVHYVKTSDGHITYPDGIDAKTTGFNMGVNWQWGDYLSSYLWQGMPLDSWDIQREYNENAKVSIATGFLFDTTKISTEYATVTSVLDEFGKSVGCGFVDPDKYLPQMLEKMKNAGLEKLLAEKQRQFDEWLAG